MNELSTDVTCPKCGNIQEKKYIHCQKCAHEMDEPYFEKKTGQKMIIKGVAIWTIITLLVFLADQSIFVYKNLDTEAVKLLLPIILLICLSLSIGLFFLIKSINLSELKINRLAKVGFGLSISSLWIWIATSSTNSILLKYSDLQSNGSLLHILLVPILIKMYFVLLLALSGGIISLFALSKIKKSKEGGRTYAIFSLTLLLVFSILFTYSFINQ